MSECKFFETTRLVRNFEASVDENIICCTKRKRINDVLNFYCLEHEILTD